MGRYTGSIDDILALRAYLNCLESWKIELIKQLGIIND